MADDGTVKNVIPPVETFIARTVPLLVEYRAKFAGALERLKRLADRAAYNEFYHVDRVGLIRAEIGAADEWYARVRPAAQRLAQNVSGMIEQGNLTELEKTELQLRLAEFEAALLTFPDLLNVYRKLTT